MVCSGEQSPSSIDEGNRSDTNVPSHSFTLALEHLTLQFYNPKVDVPTGNSKRKVMGHFFTTHDSANGRQAMMPVMQKAFYLCPGIEDCR